MLSYAKFRLFDTPAFMARDIQAMNNIARAWYCPIRFTDIPKDKNLYPQKILWPADYCDPTSKHVLTQNEHVHATFEKFVVQLETFLGVKRTVISLRTLWQEDNLLHFNESFDDYFRYTYETIVNKDSYDNNRDFVTSFEDSVGHHP